MNKRIIHIVVGAIGSGIFVGVSVFMGLLTFVNLGLAILSEMQALDLEYDRISNATTDATWAAIFAAAAVVSIFQTVSAMRSKPPIPK